MYKKIENQIDYYALNHILGRVWLRKFNLWLFIILIFWITFWHILNTKLLSPISSYFYLLMHHHHCNRSDMHILIRLRLCNILFSCKEILVCLSCLTAWWQTRMETQHESSIESGNIQFICARTARRRQAVYLGETIRKHTYHDSQTTQTTHTKYPPHRWFCSFGEGLYGRGTTTGWLWVLAQIRF